MVTQDATETSVIWRAADGKLQFEWSIEKSFVLDGYPYDYFNNRSVDKEFPFPDEVSLTIIQGVTPCVENVLWQNFTVDPTLTIIFAEDPSQPTSKSGKKVPVAAIVVPIVVIVLIVVIIVVLFMTIPSFRLLITPHHKRTMMAKSKKSSSIQDDNRQATWSKAEKPQN